MIVNAVDSRARIIALGVAPYAGVCLIQTKYNGRPGVVGFGTGFVMANRIVTAGHVVWNDLNGQAMAGPIKPDRVEVYLGEGLFKGHASLTWVLGAKDVAVHPGFVAGDIRFDLAHLSLPIAPGGDLAIEPFPGALAVGDDVTISGYPVEKTPFGAYEASGPMTTDATPVFHHGVDTTEGQSGAPVRAPLAGAWRVVGVHLGDIAAEGGPVGNRALALTPELITWLQT